MLTICKDVLRKLTEVFRESSQEEGFLLGCTSRLDCLDCCEQIPASRAGMYFYEPDVACANKIIQCWASQGTCYCGFIHSHVMGKNALSIADIEFAKRIYAAYHLPELWFGIGVVGEEKVEYLFFSVTRDNGDITILPVDFIRLEES